MKKTLLTLTLLALTGGAFAKTLVTVNNQPIDSSLIDHQVQVISQNSKGAIKDTPKLRASLLDRAVVNAVVMDEAKRLKLDQTPKYKETVDKILAVAKEKGYINEPDFKSDLPIFKENLLVMAYADYVLKKHPVPQDQIKKAYNEISNFYKGSKEVQLSEIITNTQASANNVIAQLKKGKKFSDLAKKYSVDPKGKANGGKNTNYLSLKQMQEELPNLYKAINPLNVGQYTNPIPVKGKFVIFEVSDKRAVQVPPFDEIKDEIKGRLSGIEVNKAIVELMKHAKIVPAK